jgi:hypothetical protein
MNEPAKAFIKAFYSRRYHCSCHPRERWQGYLIYECTDRSYRIKQYIKTSRSSAGLDVDNTVLEGPPRSFADLLALLLVADQVQSIVNQQTTQDHGDNSVANLSFLPFVQLPSRNFCLPSFSEDDGVLN